MHDAIILDTETTCTENAEVVELYWESYSRNERGVHDAYHSFYFPTGEISLGALATHHILLEDLEGKPPSAQALTDVPQCSYWIGHNVDFDWRALGSPPQVKRICTLAMCRAIWPNCGSHSLTAMVYFLKGKNSEVREMVRAAHGAKADVGLCALVLQRIVEDEGIENVAQLYAFSEECRLPRIMTFGKFKGQPVSAVDKGWANWYARQEDTDPYLLASLRRERKL